jgi:hypothetical protein
MVMGEHGAWAKRWATAGVVITGLLTAASCTTLLGIDKDYYRESPGAGGGCIAPEGSICVKTCSSSENGRCDGYACIQGACLTRCAGDADCASDAYCEGTSCLPRQKLGVACSDDKQCLGSICENQICCTERCGNCKDCDMATGGCKYVGADQEDGETCIAPRACDGKGNCLQAAGDTCSGNLGCRAPFPCVDGFCCDTNCSGPCSSCKITGAEGVCSPVALNDIDEGPVPCGGTLDTKHACNGAGVCALVRNQPCTKAIDCVSGDCSGTPLTCQ